nr:MAG TPA: hypothetical protein [Caudoviricetes sp.]
MPRSWLRKDDKQCVMTINCPRSIFLTAFGYTRDICN